MSINPGITIALPWPSAELWPNRKEHWMVKARAARRAKSDGHFATLQALNGRKVYETDGPIGLRIIFHPPNKRRRDLDNAQAAIKHYLDGIALGLGVDDSKFRPQSDWGDTHPHGFVEVVFP